ncbi:MAG: adenylate/guanylate cyclase domain-containing protein [Treponema sp.]|nr:adenylate/guanylate cyclase domain-containing protein [Treponema sp.]MBR5033541.1 adenylate/guanylate cyclase domain-containing protein [Treponema sp.]
MSSGKGFFSKVGKTRIVPLGLKILVIFVIIILLSNFATNFLSLQLSKKEIINLNNTIMVEQLKELYTNSTNQFQIYNYSDDKDGSLEALKKVAKSGFSNKNSVAIGVMPGGEIIFAASNNNHTDWSRFYDLQTLDKLNQDYSNDIKEGSVSFNQRGGDYFGVYKYQADWGYYLIRAENRSDLDANTNSVYLYALLIIIILTIAFVVIGWIILRHEFRPVTLITKDLYEMQQHKQLELIDLSHAKNDDITYLAASFNSLSSSVNNLLGTFQKFVPKDVVAKAYSDQGIGLEGSQRELAMLFSDIKSFTYRTETLGNDIIDVLNVHYNRVIHNVHENAGVVGSIIGDAILAVYGTLESRRSKSYNAILAAWDITHATAALRETMKLRRVEIEKKRKLTESEERIFIAVSLDVGVGIDGGNVFYGNIGSNEHMANTVIGDNVNSASRLEGLTRIYHLPVIVSEYIKDEVLAETARFKFYEIDTVQVKGKTQGKKIYFPFDTNEMDNALLAKYDLYEEGLQAYYSGDWKNARKNFKNAELPELTEVFMERMGNKSAPEGWNGIWTMTTK